MQRGCDGLLHNISENTVGENNYLKLYENKRDRKPGKGQYAEVIENTLNFRGKLYG